METAETCFVCGEPLHELDANRFGCDGCKRIWKKCHEGWESEPRQVRFRKEPEIGDNLNDIVENVKPE